MDLEQYLRIKNAAEFLGISENTLRNWVQRTRAVLVAIAEMSSGFRQRAAFSRQPGP